jgi:hypothetical protein
LVSWGAAWAVGHGWLGVPPPAAEVTLAPAAIAMALAAGLGLVAFRTDLPAYRFGWRQLASTAAAAAIALGTLPVLGAAVDGRWHLPAHDYRGQLSWMPDKRADGDFRVLWVGDPEALPLDGWHLDDGLAYGLSDNALPDVVDRWPGSDTGATRRTANAVVAARDARTTRVGRALAPSAVRYIVVVDRAAPTSDAPRFAGATDDIVRALAVQLDLKLVSSDRDEVVYENAAWAKRRGAVHGPRSSLARDVVVLVELGLWVLAVRYLIVSRPRRRTTAQ